MCRACAKLNVTTKNGERNECLWHVAGRSVFGSFFFLQRFEGAFCFLGHTRR